MAEQLLLSAYEIARQKLIKDNAAMLASLGLGPGQKSSPAHPGTNANNPGRKSRKSNAKAPGKGKKTISEQPVRRSTRIRGQVKMCLLVLLIRSCLPAKHGYLSASNMMMIVFTFGTES